MRAPGTGGKDASGHGHAFTHMFVMEVIVRPQDRALCASITCITGIMRPEGRT